MRCLLGCGCLRAHDPEALSLFMGGSRTLGWVARGGEVDRSGTVQVETVSTHRVGVKDRLRRAGGSPMKPLLRESWPHIKASPIGGLV